MGEGQWDELTNKSVTSTFFQGYHWIKIWLKHFASSIQETIIVCIYENEQLIGIAPFSLNDKSLEFLTISSISDKISLSDYGDIIAKVGYERVVWKSVVAALDEYCRLHDCVVRYRYIRELSPSYSILPSIINISPIAIDVAPHIQLPNTWDAYLKKLSNHQRHEIKRKLKNAEQTQLTLLKGIANQATANHFICLARGVHLDSEKQNFFTLEVSAFFTDLITTLGSLKKLEVNFLCRGKEYVGALIVFLYKDEWLAYNSSYDPQYSYLSPGIVLFSLIMQHAMDRGIYKLDFLRGDEHYKYHLGASPQILYLIGESR